MSHNDTPQDDFDSIIGIIESKKRDKKLKEKEAQMKRDPAGHMETTCRLCLKTVSYLKNLTRHVQTKHSDHWKPKTKRDLYVARKDQSVPDDSDFYDSSHMASSEKSDEEMSGTIQINEISETPLFVQKSALKEKIDDLMGCLESQMSQDDIFCFGVLTEVLPSISKKKDFQHFTLA